ncbi:MAG: FG-GAP-like repeat-containing protein, partial [Phycisphaerae bacterium]
MYKILQASPVVTLFGLLALDATTRSSYAQCVEGCTAIHTLVGQAAGDLFGWEAKNLGDVDGDDVNDFIVSASGRDEGGSSSGKVYVYSGATGAEIWSRSGTVAGGQFGFSSNRVGDLNGDGASEVVVGQPTGANGSVRILSGVDGAVLRTINGAAANDQFGYRSVGGGDVNGDGTPDFLVGAPRHDTAGTNAGRVYVYSGADFSLLGTVDGESSADQHGTALGILGDRDFDGRDEIVVCAKNAGTTAGGRAYVYTYDGSAFVLLATIEPPANSVDFSEFFCNGGHDMNRDGVPDFYASDFQTNRAYVYSGATFERLETFTGDGNGQFGIGELSP